MKLGDERKVIYEHLKGCFLHLSNITMLNISFSTSFFLTFMQAPSSNHLEKAKHLIGYSVITRSLGTLYLTGKGKQFRAE